MDYKERTKELVKKVLEIARKENKLSGFCIGNTTKIDNEGLFFTPIRNTSIMVVAGVIVYSIRQAVDVSEIVDGKVDYVLVDAEKKISDKMSLSGNSANVERSVREVIAKSVLWIYKGNDIAVDAIDSFLTYLTKDSLRGLGGKKITILGAGNLGCKLALKLVERGACVFITRREPKKVNIIAEALNYIKPAYTTSKVTGLTDNEEAAKEADVLIGMTQGIPVITSKIIENLSQGALIIDGGKGTLCASAFETIERLKVDVYRLDISGSFEGLIHNLFATENLIKKKMGRRMFNAEPIVSGGLLGRKGEIVVDNINNPKIVYGIANGSGDFIRNPEGEYAARLMKIQTIIERSNQN